MTRNRVTISDVAREAGVSTGTVSRVLNHRHGDIPISDATKQQVLDAVERLGYQPNPFAAALRSQRTGAIGVIVRDIGDPFLSLMARKLQQVAHAKGIECLLGHAQYDLKTAGRQVSLMRSSWFDGVLLLGDMPGDQTIIDDLRQAGTPFVAVACGPQSETPFVNIDDAAGIEKGLDYLHGLGHRRIAFIGNLEHSGISERFKAFRHYIQDNSLFWIDDYLQPCPNTRRAAIHCIHHLLRLPQPPTAVFCATDLQALGAINGSWQFGCRVPEVISIIGFDDIEEAVDALPPLTTVRQPVGDMSERAIEVLTTLIEDSFVEEMKSRVLIQPELIVRRSCSPPPA